MNSVCPVCDAEVSLPANVEVSEVVNCPDCGTRLVVERMEDKSAFLIQAPDVEEDWGE